MDISKWIIEAGYTIEIVNIKTCPHKDGHYVGRPTALGNPFSAYDREINISKYKQWLDLQYMSNNRRVTEELEMLARELRDKGKIILRCWCAPKDCHAEVIGQALLALIDKKLI